MKSMAVRRTGALGPLLGSHLLTAVGDNALLIVAIALLEQSGAAQWMSPALRICLYVSYVALAPWTGALADAMPKGRLIVFVNLAKLAGCVLLAARVHPLIAFGAIGLAGVSYGPARYGILAELIPERHLVWANAWIEVVTVAAILGGATLGFVLLKAPLASSAVPTAAHQATLLLAALFGAAALWAIAIPATACSKAPRTGTVRAFGHHLSVLWADTQGRVSLAVTALFWAMAAVLQFLVIRWAQSVLHLSLGEAGLLQCCLAVGVVAGSLGVVRFITASSALRVLPMGAVLGIAILLIGQVTQLWAACLTLVCTGAVAGWVMVPMNAMLQQRGNSLMQPGASIAVQSFGENLASLVFLAIYGVLLAVEVPLQAIIAGLGLLVTAMMTLILRSTHDGTRRVA